jgi:hypothetical protein
MLQNTLYLYYVFINWIAEVNQHIFSFYFIALENKSVPPCIGARGGAVVKALRYKPEGRGIDSRW